MKERMVVREETGGGAEAVLAPEAETVAEAEAEAEVVWTECVGEGIDVGGLVVDCTAEIGPCPSSLISISFRVGSFFCRARPFLLAALRTFRSYVYAGGYACLATR